MEVKIEDFAAACKTQPSDLLALVVEVCGTAAADRVIFEAGRVASGERRKPKFKDGAIKVAWPRWR